MKPLVSNALWAVVEPLLPPEPPKPKGGRPRLWNRAVLNGILYVLRTGTAWELLPPELGWGSGMTCWRPLRDRQQAGVWDRLHRVLLEHLAGVRRIDWSRAASDSSSVPAKRGGHATGPNPTDRDKAGSKRHLIVDRQGIPLAVRLTAANVHDSKVLEELLDAVPPLRTERRGRPRRRPAKLHADRGYGYQRCRDACRRRHIVPRIARRGTGRRDSPGRHRWVVERTLAWFSRFRRLRVRDERRADIHEAFLRFAAAPVCWNFVVRLDGRRSGRPAEDVAHGVTRGPPRRVRGVEQVEVVGRVGDERARAAAARVLAE